MKKWNLLFCALLLAGCQNWGNERTQKKLKILNSFSADTVLAEIWPDLFAAFRCRYKNINALAVNIAPEHMFNRIERMASLNSMPNVLYMRADSLATEYLATSNLLQNLRSEQRSGALAQLDLFPAALTPQGYGQNTLWFLPLTLDISNVLFVNEQLLQDEGLSPPETLEELTQSVALLKERGYQYPLLTHSSYVENLLHNVLSTLAVRHADSDFFYQAIENPELFQSKGFRENVEEYISFLREDGIFPPSVRSLDAASSLRYFNLGLSAFMFASPEISEFFIGGKKSTFRWQYLPIGEDLIQELGPGLKDSSLKRQIAAGEIEPGYGITKETVSSPVLKEHAFQFFNFLFTDGLEFYQQEDVSYTVFSVPLQNAPSDSPAYVNKRDFYHSRSFVVNDIWKDILFGGKEDLLMRTIQEVLDGKAGIDKIISLFYSNALKHKVYVDRGISGGGSHQH